MIYTSTELTKRMERLVPELTKNMRWEEVFTKIAERIEELLKKRQLAIEEDAILVEALLDVAAMVKTRNDISARGKREHNGTPKN